MISAEMVFQNQKLDRDPSLEQIPIGRYGVVADGVNLPSSITEDVRGSSLRPSYSAKQLRRIVHIAKKKADHENRYLMSSQRNNENYSEWYDLLTTSSYLRNQSQGEDLE
jgi:hypothetical protein